MLVSRFLWNCKPQPSRHFPMVDWTITWTFKLPWNTCPHLSNRRWIVLGEIWHKWTQLSKNLQWGGGPVSLKDTSGFLYSPWRWLLVRVKEGLFKTSIDPSSTQSNPISVFPCFSPNDRALSLSLSNPAVLNQGQIFSPYSNLRHSDISGNIFDCHDYCHGWGPGI